jgi:hypothetical protein
MVISRGDVRGLTCPWLHYTAPLALGFTLNVAPQARRVPARSKAPCAVGPGSESTTHIHYQRLHHHASAAIGPTFTIGAALSVHSSHAQR